MFPSIAPVKRWKEQSLRQHYLEQVQRVFRIPPRNSQPFAPHQGLALVGSPAIALTMGGFIAGVKPSADGVSCAAGFKIMTLRLESERID